MVVYLFKIPGLPSIVELIAIIYPATRFSNCGGIIYGVYSGGLRAKRRIETGRGPRVIYDGLKLNI